jgi:hypothetical protein
MCRNNNIFIVVVCGVLAAPSAAFFTGVQTALRAPSSNRHHAAVGVRVLAKPEVPAVVADAKTVEQQKQELLKLGLVTCRGERASADDKKQLARLVDEMKKSSSVDEMKKSFSSEGDWDLVMTDTQLFRSSPFFMAARAVVKDGSDAEQFNWFCDQHRSALDFSQIGRVRQVVRANVVRSEFEVKVGLATIAFGLPLSVTGWIVTTADIIDAAPTAEGDVEEWKLAIKSVQVLYA